MSELRHSHADLRHFDHILGTRTMFRVREVAGILDLSDGMIERLIEQGRVPCHAFNSGTGKRMTYRVTRNGLLAFLLETKKYPAEVYLGGVIELLEKLSVPELAVVESRLPQLLARAKARVPHSP